MVFHRALVPGVCSGELADRLDRLGEADAVCLLSAVQRVLFLGGVFGADPCGHPCCLEGHAQLREA